MIDRKKLFRSIICAFLELLETKLDGTTPTARFERSRAVRPDLS